MFRNKILQIQEYIYKNIFFKNILVAASGTIFAQSLGLITTPIITRIYTPNDYGMFSAILAVVMVLSSVSTLRYEIAIPIERDLNKIFSLVKLCLLISLSISALVFLTIIFFSERISIFLDLKDSQGLLFLIPVLLLINSFFKIFNFVNVRFKAFKFISKVKVIQSLLASAIKISFGISGFNYLGLVYGNLGQEALGIFAFYSKFKKKGFKLFILDDISGIKALAIKYIKFAKYQTPSQLLLSVSQRLPTLFIVAIFSSKELGYFSLAFGMLSLPINLIGSSVSNVFYSEISEIGTDDSKKIYSLSVNILKKLFAIGIIPTAVVLLFGSDIFSYVFGEQWLIAGELAELLIVLILIRFVVSPIMSCLNLYGMQRFQLKVNALRLTILLLTFFIVDYLGFNLHTVILVFVTVSCLIYLYQTLIVLQKIKK